MNAVSTIEEYIQAFPTDVQTILQKIRQIMINVYPTFEETISYGVPTMKIDGKYVIYFAGFKHHISIYPAPRGAKEFEQELSQYKGGTGTVQFPLDKPIPYELIKKMTQFRVKERLEKNT